MPGGRVGVSSWVSIPGYLFYLRCFLYKRPGSNWYFLNFEMKFDWSGYLVPDPVPIRLRPDQKHCFLSRKKLIQELTRTDCPFYEKNTFFATEYFEVSNSFKIYKWETFSRKNEILELHRFRRIISNLVLKDLKLNTFF